MHEWQNRCPWRLRLDMMFKAKACHREASLAGAKSFHGVIGHSPDNVGGVAKAITTKGCSALATTQKA